MRRVLVVDDEENIRLVLRTLLKRHGYEVETAASGEDARGLVDSFGPDVVITDVRMPRMDGIQMCESIREMDPDVAIIFVTAFDEKEYLKSAFNCGAAGYLEKPVDVGRLAKLLGHIAQESQVIHELDRLQLLEEDHHLVQEECDQALELIHKVVPEQAEAPEVRIWSQALEP